MSDHSPTVYLETMGCQMNALDSELVMGELSQGGYVLTDRMAAADLVIFNTCSVRQHAEDKVHSRLGQLASMRDRPAGQVVAVIGCMAERDADGLLVRGCVDILCGPNDLHRLPTLIESVRVHRQPEVALSGRMRDRSTYVAGEGMSDIESLDTHRRLGPAGHVPVPRVFGERQAYVRITRGCNKFCTFCVVPLTRGPEVHRPPDRIVEEVRKLVDHGVVEVTLLGQTVNHYRFQGDDGRPPTSFADLLRRVHDEVPDLPRLRFVTSYPRDFTDETLDVMAASPRICRYLHLPAQSGSNAVLKRMNRGYTVEQYRDLLDRARSRLPDVALAGDMIVGFSGETEEDFEQSLELLRYARYKNCFIFKYSPRPGTYADGRLPDDVPESVKRSRNQAMLAVQAEINLANHRSLLGRTMEVLVEGYSKAALKAQESEQSRGEEVDRSAARGGQLVGRTPGDQIVVFHGKPDMIGRLLTVRVTGATPYTLHGVVQDGPSGR